MDGSRPPGLRVRDAAPRGLGALFWLLLVLVLLPAAAASVLRAALGLPLWGGAAVGGVGALGITGWALTRLRLWPTHLGGSLLQGLYLAAVARVMLGIPVLDGLVSVGGGDAGNHAALRMDFVTRDPGTYQGFTFFHTVTYGAQWLFGLDTFAGFRVGFYLVPAVLAVALAAALELVAVRLWRSARAWAVAQGALLALTLTVWPFLLLRLLHYHQSDGFYGHLFGLVPRVLAWVAYALPRTAWVRCAALAGFTVLYRFTYGLNLGDFLLMAGVLALGRASFPSAGSSAPWRGSRGSWGSRSWRQGPMPIRSCCPWARVRQPRSPGCRAGPADPGLGRGGAPGRALRLLPRRAGEAPPVRAGALLPAVPRGLDGVRHPDALLPLRVTAQGATMRR
ncbi:hypothetical protein [Stigmatella erecta]|uniref:Uncharacterized protein n=1 Tax=Stigmatella erecta TaxID=83460 RepID=A0A1I0DUK7_9BACT|nr:hypothetical protein [Stigmatella erecta]SET36325.1 hypothetical protein SAMN05443639_102703 [Stigmatella erecta]